MPPLKLRHTMSAKETHPFFLVFIIEMEIIFCNYLITCEKSIKFVFLEMSFARLIIEPERILSFSTIHFSAISHFWDGTEV